MRPAEAEGERPYPGAGGGLPEGGAPGSGRPRDSPALARPEPPEPPTEERPVFFARTFVRALPALLVVIGGCYDYLTPRGFSAAPLFTAAPLIAAPLLSRRATLLIGVAAVAVGMAVDIRYGDLLQVEALTEQVTVVTVAALALLINGLVRRSHARLHSAWEIAEAAQLAVLPEPMERIGGFEVAARYEAAQADAFIGGDLYAVQDSRYGVRLVVGDVRGKGMGAVAAVAVVVGAFREAAEHEATLEAVARRLERALTREGTRRDAIDAFEGFTTAVLAEIPHEDGVVRILNRGHPPPLMLYADGTVRPLPARQAALPLGMGELASWPDRAEESRFPGGATLLLYTDGLSEARDARGVFYDPAARLAGRTFGGPAELLCAVAEDVRRHSEGGTTDDMALLAVRRPSPGVMEQTPSA
ncbi:PP2C family protein-serine/threonine phosphatase [Streptomyces chromofuscus]|uniref:Serine/threonine-protein phosphatase n=1 Tax=Streptomyces chromofuscus TaxID=42881 RepID=A0A7M2T2G4_STRCW|nr:PP2C family protein-serine/threonine phosphatase [Streptomyces chromofuscus]QOV41711.1 serine/threonine-protein phosphatase [Streptomyces chromofuscus]GGS89084.1 membrane protein [Streptomyces chromofuscus]